MDGSLFRWTGVNSASDDQPCETDPYLHVITGLAAGGAERKMIEVASGLDPLRFESHIVSISRDAVLAPVIRAAGIRLTMLQAHPFRSLGVGPLWRVAQLLRREKPDIVQTWLFHADLVGGIAAWAARLPVIWNIRASMSDSGWRPLTPSVRLRLVARICEALSGVVPRKIRCSLANVRRNMRRYPQEKIHVIGNGVDLELFKPGLMGMAAMAQRQLTDSPPAAAAETT
ncbi:MAG TPA: glycosyltransferase [Thermoanaerobaculia bacterium]|jgi:glycosyltransferase involved in cell wall biosynthesis|nr:glycosyltransferase [Thermoanaerobaculia bacterium]